MNRTLRSLLLPRDICAGENGVATDGDKFLSPELLRLLVDARIPFSKSDPIDYGKAINTVFFNQDPESGADWRKAWPILQVLSSRGLDQIPDWFELLPPPEDKDFPLQALGLQLLLDQAPRVLLRGVDTRWIFGFFDKISLAYAKRLQDLPEDINPTSWVRWRDVVSFDYFMFVRLWFGAPLVHSETTAAEAIHFTEQTRQLVEKKFNTQDPYRNRPDERWDLYGFPKMLKSQGPNSPCGVAEGTFWLLCLLDVHKPILDLYGRYPYRNGDLGRADTPEEVEWVAKAEIFKTDPEVREHIRQDVKNNRWTPLGGSQESMS